MLLNQNHSQHLSPSLFWTLCLSRSNRFPRLFLHRKADQVEAETRRVIEVAREHKGTRYYDYFQNKQQGYAI